MKIRNSLLLLLLFFISGCMQDEFKPEPRLNAALANVKLGLFYLKQDDNLRSKEKLLTALKQAPNCSSVIDAMAYFLEKTGAIKDAGVYYLRALNKDRHSGQALNNYGVYLCRRGDYKRGISFLLKAAHTDDYINTASAYQNAGFCMLAWGDKKKAKLYFIKAIKQDPNQYSSQLELAKIS